MIEPDQLAEMGGLTEEQCEIIVNHAEQESERLELEQRQRRAQEKSNQEHDRQEENRKQRGGKGAQIPPATVDDSAESNGSAAEHVKKDEQGKDEQHPAQ